MNNLILVGGGGHCKSVIDVAESAGYHIIGILDKPELVGTRVFGYTIIGTDNDIDLYANEAEFVITVGQIKSSALRHKLAELIEQKGGKLSTIIANDAIVSKYAIIGEGTIIMHKAIVNAGARVGKNCIINTMANIEHDAKVGDYCHISTGAMVNGGATIGNDTFIGSQSTVNQTVCIVDHVVVGSMSLVHKDIKVRGVYAGNPLMSIEKY